MNPELKLGENEMDFARGSEAYRTPTKLVTRQNLKLTEDFCRTLYRFYCAGSYLLDARILTASFLI